MARGRVTYIPKITVDEALRLKSKYGLGRFSDAFNMMAYRSREFPTIIPSHLELPKSIRKKVRL